MWPLHLTALFADSWFCGLCFSIAAAILFVAQPGMRFWGANSITRAPISFEDFSGHMIIPETVQSFMFLRKGIQ